MPVDADTAGERLQHRLRQHTVHCTARALRIYTPVLREHAQRSQSPDTINSFISILRNAANRRITHQTDLLDYAQALAELLSNIGGGNQFRGKEGLLGLFDRVATGLHEAGCSTTDLRLIMARYCSTISNGGDQRRRLINLALHESRTGDERLRAQLVTAKYHIDISDYDNAHRNLDTCQILAEHASTGPAQRYDIYTTRGIAYYYTDHNLAERCFLQGVALNPRITDPIICRSTASALHHLGKIKAARGDYGAAITLIVLAQHYKNRMMQEGGQLGHYHLRLGEILHLVGASEQSLWHLNQASQVFHGIRDQSSGEAHLNSTLAGLAAARGDHAKAIHLLTGAIKTAHRDRYHRGELLFRYQLTCLHLRRARLIAAFQAALPGLRAWRAAHIGKWRWIRQHLRTRRFPPRPPRRRLPLTLMPHCPCPEHDAVPETELLERSGLARMVNGGQAID